jgi:hypothetical protein
MTKGEWKNFYLPSASALWLLLTWQPLLFKPFDKIILISEFRNWAQAWLALNFWSLTPYLAGLCE